MAVTTVRVVRWRPIRLPEAYRLEFLVVFNHERFYARAAELQALADLGQIPPDVHRWWYDELPTFGMEARVVDVP